MSAAGLPVCLTRPPKLVLHPPPVSKSEIQSIPGISHTCRKTTKKQAKKGERHLTPVPVCPSLTGSPVPRVPSHCPQQCVSPVLPSSPSDSCSPSGKTPEEVLKKYLQKVRHPPDEVRAAGVVLGCRQGLLLWEEGLGTRAMPLCHTEVSHHPRGSALSPSPSKEGPHAACTCWPGPAVAPG